MVSRLKTLKRGLRRRLGLRAGNPPFTGRYYRRARRLLIDCVDLFNRERLPYTADAGTLLGLAREGDLIPWDNDLDLMLPAVAVDQLRSLAWRLRLRGWRVSRPERMRAASEAWAAGAPRCIKIRSRGWLLVTPGSTLLEVTVIHPHGDHYWWQMAGRLCRAPRRFFEAADYLDYAGRHVRVPHDYPGYLERTYGDWRTPKPDYHHSEMGTIV